MTVGNSQLVDCISLESSIIHTTDADITKLDIFDVLALALLSSVNCESGIRHTVVKLPESACNESLVMIDEDVLMSKVAVMTLLVSVTSNYIKLFNFYRKF